MRKVSFYLIFSQICTLSSALLNYHQDFRIVQDVHVRYRSRSTCPCGKDFPNNMAPINLYDVGNFMVFSNFLVSERSMGSGHFSKVYHAVMVDSEWKQVRCVAIKIPFVHNDLSDEVRAIQEMMRNNPQFADSEHIIKFLAFGNYLHTISYATRPWKLAIVMELARTNLQTYWDNSMAQYRRNVVPKEKVLLQVVRQILYGFREIHRSHYIFMDLKSANVLVMPKSPNVLNDRNYKKLALKLSDFGESEPYQGELADRNFKDDFSALASLGIGLVLKTPVVGQQCQQIAPNLLDARLIMRNHLRDPNVRNENVHDSAIQECFRLIERHYPRILQAIEFALTDDGNLEAILRIVD